MAPKKTAGTKTPASRPAPPARALTGAPARPAAVRRRVAKAPAAPVQATEPARAAAPHATVTNEDIQVRAYFLALEHGGNGGTLDFWLQAERELRAGAWSRD